MILAKNEDQIAEEFQKLFPISLFGNIKVRIVEDEIWPQGIVVHRRCVFETGRQSSLRVIRIHFFAILSPSYFVFSLNVSLPDLCQPQTNSLEQFQTSNHFQLKLKHWKTIFPLLNFIFLIFNPNTYLKWNGWISKQTELTLIMSPLLWIFLFGFHKIDWIETFCSFLSIKFQ